MNCEFKSRLSAFHDGELSPADREAMEQHLASCADCRAAVSELREMSALFAASTPRLSQIGMARLHQNVDRQRERGLVRLSAALSGIAAVIMVAGGLWLHSAGQVTNYLPSNPPISVAGYSDASTPAEQYYLADARVRNEEW